MIAVVVLSVGIAPNSATASDCGVRTDGTPVPCPSGDAGAGGISYRYDGEDLVFHKESSLSGEQEEARDSDGTVRVWSLD